jgi:hypothetical protein
MQRGQPGLMTVQWRLAGHCLTSHPTLQLASPPLASPQHATYNHVPATTGARPIAAQSPAGESPQQAHRGHP